MRKLKLFEHLSLDGVIQVSAGPVGRRNYDLWSGFWPNAPKSPMADRLNAATKYVVTHRPESRLAIMVRRELCIQKRDDDGFGVRSTLHRHSSTG